MTPGPSARIRGDALRRGWHSPLLWDDDIDDPAARPARGRRTPKHTRKEVA